MGKYYKMEELHNKLKDLDYTIMANASGTFIEFNTDEGFPYLSLEEVAKKYNLTEYKREEYVGYLGGSYEYFALHDNKKDAERGYSGGEYLYELLEEFDGKKVKITVEEIE